MGNGVHGATLGVRREWRQGRRGHGEELKAVAAQCGNRERKLFRPGIIFSVDRPGLRGVRCQRRHSKTKM